MLGQFQRTYHDVIFGYGRKVPKNRHKVTRPQRWVRNLRRWQKDNGDWEPFSWRHGGHHCKLCQAVNAPFHRRKMEWKR